MEKITIEGVDYQVAQRIDDLTLSEWVEINNIIARREYKELGKMALSDEILKEVVPVDKESDQFKVDKTLDILVLLSGVSKDLMIEYPSLQDIITELIDWSNLLKDDSKVGTDVELYGVQYKVLHPKDCLFQRWCDFENFIGSNMLIALLVYLDDGKPYNRFHPDFDTKMMMFSRVEARGNAAVLSSILGNIYAIRDDYKFIYDPEEVGSTAGRNMSEHCERFKWEDVILSIAETPMFTSDRGNLWAVRNANTLDVLDYLNIRRSKDLAEYKDMRAKDKNKTIL